MFLEGIISRLSSHIKRGFTLVELLVVLAIIAILLSLSFTGITSARIRSRDAKRVADLQTIQAALEQHALGDQSHSYPPDPGIADNQNTNYCSKYYDPTPNDGKQKGLYDNLCFKDYLSIVPLDPRGQQYEYHRPACFKTDTVPGGITMTAEPANASCLVSSASYGLHVVLESKTNPEGLKDATPTHQESYDLIP